MTLYKVFVEGRRMETVVDDGRSVIGFLRDALGPGRQPGGGEKASP